VSEKPRPGPAACGCSFLEVREDRGAAVVAEEVHSQAKLLRVAIWGTMEALNDYAEGIDLVHELMPLLELAGELELRTCELYGAAQREHAAKAAASR
jgi:hypothetical protein